MSMPLTLARPVVTAQAESSQAPAHPARLRARGDQDAASLAGAVPVTA